MSQVEKQENKSFFPVGCSSRSQATQACHVHHFLQFQKLRSEQMMILINNHIISKVYTESIFQMGCFVLVSHHSFFI